MDRNNTCEYRTLGVISTTLLIILLFAGTADAITPTIEFTYVPPYGSSDNLQGKVTNVTPADYKVAVYIYVSGWWTKPTFANPLTSIDSNGNWVCNIVTGGSDQFATKIKAYLVNNGYNPPQMNGGEILPAELDANSVANASVVRKPERHITFSGRDWIVKSSVIPAGPGLNYFTDSDQSVWVDSQGQLHLKILKVGDIWYSSEVVLTQSLGYGEYIFYLANRVDLFDKNVVNGLFTWDTAASQYNYREIDIEFSRWGNAADANAQYVIQPWNHAGNRYRFNMVLTGNNSAHAFTWNASNISFRSVQGQNLSSSDVIASWVYTGSDIPPPGEENARINLWLDDINGDSLGDPPSDGKEVELMVKKFEYLATPTPIPTTSADISVTQTSLPDPVITGNNLTYTLIVSNNGPDAAMDVILIDTLPADVNFVSATSAQGTFAQSGNNITFSLGPLGDGNSTTATIIVTPITAGQISNIVRVMANEADPVPANNVASLATTVASDILSYYRKLGSNPNIVETTDLLKAADDWISNIAPPGYTSPISTHQLLALADEWSKRV